MPTIKSVETKITELTGKFNLHNGSYEVAVMLESIAAEMKAGAKEEAKFFLEDSGNEYLLAGNYSFGMRVAHTRLGGLNTTVVKKAFPVEDYPKFYKADVTVDETVVATFIND